MPPGFTGEPFVYELIGVKKEIVSLLPFMFSFVIGIITIQLKFNEVDLQPIIRQPLYFFIPAILVLLLHELVHGGAFLVMTRPHRCPRIGIKCRIFLPMYAYLPPSAFLTKRQAVISLLMPLSLAILPMLVFPFVSSYEWVFSLFTFFLFSAGTGYNDIDQVIMLTSFQDNAWIALRNGYNVIY